MAGGKETPRQRMIGILYLVLLGLIALDVPDNLLDSFKNISDSLTASKTNVQTGIATTFKAFEGSKLKDQHDRALPIYERAQKARAMSEAFDKYVDSLKEVMITAVGGIEPSTNDYKGRDDMDVSFRLMVGDGKNRSAYTLHKKIDALKAGLLGTLKDEKERSGTNLALSTDPPKGKTGEQKDWETANFGEGIPMAAAMTALAKIQSDAKNSENEVIKKILIEADETSVNLDKFAAVAVAPSSYVLVGNPYTADVFLTAYDSQLSPNITVSGSSVPVSAGKGKYSGSTSSEGLHTWTANISFKDNNGKMQSYTTEPQSYFVAKPSAVVSPDKMNVMYIGVPNPVSVSAPGANLKDLVLSMKGGTITGGDGHYTATVTSIGAASVTVSQSVKGKVNLLGTSNFRVKRIPDPKPKFAGKSGGTTSAANLRAQDRLFATLENFEFDARFNVTRFTLLVGKPRQDIITLSSPSGELTSAMKQVMGSILPGSVVIFKDIIAVGPDGTQRGLDAIVFNAN